MTQPHRNAHWRSVWLLSAILSTAVVIASCGIGLDSKPRPASLDFQTTTTSVREAGSGVKGVLYYVSDGTLVPLVTQLANRYLATLVSAVLGPPTALMASRGVITSIPSGTTLLDVKTKLSGNSDGPATSGDESDSANIRNETVVVNLSSAFDNVLGVSRQQAIAQVVLTVTQRPTVRDVEFQVEGEAIRVSSPTRGDSIRVGECDFKDLLATREKAHDAGLPAATVELTAARRKELKDCH